jgi:hypothetical protein
MRVDDAERLAGSLVALNRPRAVIVAIAALLLTPTVQSHFDSSQLPSLLGREAERANTLDKFFRAFSHIVSVSCFVSAEYAPAEAGAWF